MPTAPHHNAIVQILQAKRIATLHDLPDLFAKRKLATFVNPLSIRNASAEYAESLAAMDYLFVDGMLMNMLCRKLLGASERWSFDGNSLAPYAFKMAAERGLAVAFVGGKEGIAEKAATILQTEHGFRTSLVQPGFFGSNAERAARIDELCNANFDMLVCGMGQLHQERFLLDMRRRKGPFIGFTCGGYLDQVCQSDRAQFYPPWAERLNLRALYRVLKEDKPLLRRYLVDYQPFYKLLFTSYASFR